MHFNIAFHIMHALMHCRYSCDWHKFSIEITKSNVIWLDKLSAILKSDSVMSQTTKHIKIEMKKVSVAK